jgi:uncharacterized protein (DUF1697 family)
MASVVFLRGVNVGGHRTFQPKLLAKELADLGAVNVGAAGTFVIRSLIGQRALRAEFLRKLPFEPELMICPSRALLDLAKAEPFSEETPAPGSRPFVSVLAQRPLKLPPLPFFQPVGDEWQVKVIGITGQFVLSLWRRLGRTIIYPNAVVEKQFAVPATTRGWDTITAVCAILQGE